MGPELILALLQVIKTVTDLAANPDVVKALMDSEHLTDDDRARITALRKAVVSEWNSLAPKE